MSTGIHVSPDMDIEDALAHYGIKGMRWGHRKSEDTSGGGASTKKSSTPSSSAAKETLSPRAVARQERRNEKVANLTARAHKMDVRVSEIRSEIKALPPGVKSSYKRYGLNNDLNLTIQERNSLREDARRVKNGKLTKGQRNLLIGAGAAALIVGGVYGAQMAQSGQLNSYKLRGQALLKGQKFDFKKDPKLSGFKTPDDVLKHVARPVNPNYGIPGGQMNCRRSTFTYELRRRGYDVQATTSAMGWGQSETGVINALTKGRNINGSTSLSTQVSTGAGIRGMLSKDNRVNPAQVMSIKDANDRLSVFKALASQPDGARGEIVFDFKGFGHSLAYENFNGKPHIFDSQKGIKYDMSKPDEYLAFIQKWSGAGGVRGAEITRLDNMDLDHLFLSRWATNRK